MNGMDIIRHGIDMLLRNLSQALRISAGPFVLLFLATLVLAAIGLGAADVNPETGEITGSIGGGALGGLIGLLLGLLVFSWVAVAWHRYVLLEERPAGLLPAFRSELVWPYLGRSVLIAVILIVAAIPLGLLLGLVFAAGQSVAATVIVGLVMWIVLGWLGMRLSLVLPARAVDKPITFGESWAATAPASGAIALVVVVLGVLNVLLSLLFAQVGANVVGTLLGLILQWFTTMIGLSVLTTLYGSLVERRQLAV